MECIYNVDEFCTNDQCPMCADYCPVPNDEGVCRFEEREEDRWVLTPKGCFTAALTNHIKLDEDIIDFIWKDFSELMKKHGYVEE
jgi:hypothetical protein